MQFLRTYSALIAFLGSYFFLTVLGNLIYFTPFGDSIGGWSKAGFSIRNFEFVGSPGYWALLFLPFVVAPPITLAARRLFVPVADAIPRVRPSAAIFFALSAICYAIAAWSLWRADAADLLFQGSTGQQAASSRFELMDRLGFWPLVLVKAVMVTLSIYAIVMALRERATFWLAAVVCNVVGMSVILTLLNAKWPLVLFYLSHLAAIFLFAKRPLLPGAAFAVLALVGYSVSSMILLRAIPVERMIIAPAQNVPAMTISPAKETPISAERVQGVATLTVLAPINRMAQPFPYYFDTFTREPGKCGTILDRVRRISSPCHPSNLIYAELFKDSFSDVGTTPQAVHVSGYALDGWFGALLELTIASIILGAFAAIASLRSEIHDTMTVLGALTGYFFSQLPIEGPIVYDHGLLWSVASLGVLALLASTSNWLMRARAFISSSRKPAI